jgi:hypothetical protein
MQVVKWIQRQHFPRPGDGAEFFAGRVLRMPIGQGEIAELIMLCRYMRRLTRFTYVTASGCARDGVGDCLADVLGDIVERDLDRLAGRAVGELGDAVG